MITQGGFVMKKAPLITSLICLSLITPISYAHSSFLMPPHINVSQYSPQNLTVTPGNPFETSSGGRITNFQQVTVQHGAKLIVASSTMMHVEQLQVNGTVIIEPNAYLYVESVSIGKNGKINGLYHHF